MRTIVGAIFAQLLLAASLGGADLVQRTYPAACTDGVVHAPHGPFAVWVFCEDAHATHVGVVYAQHMAAPVDGAWGVSDRFWQQAEWASDVRTFAWSADGEHLFISTGGAYGTSSLYQLDLRKRKTRKLSGPSADQSIEIIAARSGRVRFLLRHVKTGAVVERQVRLQGN